MELTTIIYTLCAVIAALAGVIVKLATAYDALRKEDKKSDADCNDKLDRYRKELQEVQDERIRDLKERRDDVEVPREMVSLLTDALKKAKIIS